MKIYRLKNLLGLVLNRCGVFRMGCQIRATTKGTAIAIAILVAAFALAGLPVMAFSAVIHPRMTMVTGCHVQVQVGLVGTAISEAGTDRSCPPKEEREA